VQQYLHRTIEEKCLYSSVERGISLGCPLSPIMAALYLDLLDRRMEKTGLFYVRFMDDWVILAPTRWALRRGVAVVNLTTVGVVGEAAPSVRAFEERALRLYEQDAPPEWIRRRVGD